MKKIIILLFSVFLFLGCASKEEVSEQPAPVKPVSQPPTEKPPGVQNPPFNNFDQSSNVPKKAIEEGLTSAATGTFIGSIMSSPAPVVGGLIGGAVGGAIGAIDQSKEESPENIIKYLKQEHIQVVQEGKLITLIVPTDVYYEWNSYQLDETTYAGLNHIAQLVLHDSGNSRIYIAGFSDDGISNPKDDLKLSEQQARSMADFLWANGVPLHRMRIIGYGKRYDIADNSLIHGAAMNRRVEIQWETQCCPPLSGNICRD